MAGTAWAMVRVLECVFSDLRHPRQRESVAAQQVMQIVASCVHECRVRLKQICDQEINAVACRNTVRSPNVVPRLHAVAVWGGMRALHNRASLRKSPLADCGIGTGGVSVCMGQGVR